MDVRVLDLRVDGRVHLADEQARDEAGIRAVARGVVEAGGDEGFGAAADASSTASTSCRAARVVAVDAHLFEQGAQATRAVARVAVRRQRAEDGRGAGGGLRRA